MLGVSNTTWDWVQPVEPYDLFPSAVPGSELTLPGSEQCLGSVLHAGTCSSPSRICTVHGAHPRSSGTWAAHGAWSSESRTSTAREAHV